MPFRHDDQELIEATGALLLATGEIFFGRGCGASGMATAEICFNTAMTGYQEILTDPSYAAQVVVFTFPHIGNVGANDDDHEESSAPAAKAARGAVFRGTITSPSNWRAVDHFDAWLRRKNIVGLSGIDTRAVTRRIRTTGMVNGIVANIAPDEILDVAEMRRMLSEFQGIEGADLAKDVGPGDRYEHAESVWEWKDGFTALNDGKYHVAVLDFGVKKNILRNLSSVGARCTVLPGNATAEDVLALNPDGIVLSNGPGDPAATGIYAGPEIKKLIDSGLPILGICLGHQMLALALGAKTMKMPQGHHGANHPVKDMETGKVEIVSMNHGFTVDPVSLPDGVEQSHVSLFDGTNSGLKVIGKPIISVQHHPEASPGPQDSFYLFKRFADLMDAHKAKADA
ncbi:MAG: carbamoyl phosphate synthase small subunit [Ponticaulis sp.]|nr:carbamoyl phosphate synthase small subunit [Ponticaulis sp.]|tara:strand:- start:15994 stop:17190 length:1197 start_codon:yes stop_codon:yes gene_type:complete